MEDLQSNEILNDIFQIDTTQKTNIDKSNENDSPNVSSLADSNTECSSTSIVEYKAVDEPCVALTIIGENRLTNAEIFVKRGFKFSVKAFFSTLVLTIMNMFI